MTTLKTYDRSDKQAASIAPVQHSRWRRPKLAPGTLVEDTNGSQGGRGLGLVVGITAAELAVLWSVEPATQRSVELERNPMSVDEDYYLPSGTTRPTFVAQAQPTEPVSDPENDAWVIRQLKRMAGMKQ